MSESLRNLMKIGVAFSALAAVSCSTGIEPPTTAHATNALAPFSYVPPPGPGSFSDGFREGPLPASIAAACGDERWIGYILGSSPMVCPATGTTPGVGTWTVSKLFGTPTPARPAELNRFCVYEWAPVSSYTGSPDISLLPDVATIRVERDCNVVVPLFVPGPSAPIFEDAFAAQLNLPDFPGAADFPTNIRAHVAVIDSSPTELASGMPSSGADGHGFAVGAIARNASCIYSGGEQRECGAFIKSYQALSYNQAEMSYGTPSQVGVAMSDAIRDWKNLGTNDRLILNLSVGWDGTYSAHHGPDMRITSLAPWLVAQWAACEGALVIAAAGNRAHVGGDSGPMFPAGWEEDERLCVFTDANYAPLVHAVGAVDGRDQRIRLMRADGAPRLMAPGAFAAMTSTNTAGAQEVTRLMTGTSVSAAVTSGVAALVWSLAPNLAAEEVMMAVYSAGVNVWIPSEFWAGASRWWAHRIDACAAANLVCGPGHCPNTCPVRPFGGDARPNHSSALELEIPGLAAGPVTPGSDFDKAMVAPGGPEVTAHPYAGPQPGGTICPLCELVGTYLEGLLEIPDDTTVEAVYFRPEGCSPEWCDPEVGGFQIEIPDPSQPFKIDLAGAFDPGEVTSALLEVHTITDGEPVLRAAEVFVP